MSFPRGREPRAALRAENRHVRVPGLYDEFMTFDPKTSGIILTTAQMDAADRAAIAAGTPGIELMAAAGAAVADAAQEVAPEGLALVLAGPGNNGGDGFAAAEALRRRGRDVRLMLLGGPENLHGDAALAAGDWQGATEPLDITQISDDAGVLIDAMFGAGLARPLEGAAKAAVEAMDAANAPVVAVDLPSGVAGDTGQVLGAAARAAVTVTFCRRKPAHLLYPGRDLCGVARVADIGIPDAIVESVGAKTFANSHTLWAGKIPRPGPGSHKYTRGHLTLWGGAEMTGAPRLAARAARRLGAGLLTLVCPERVEPIYAASEPGLLIKGAPGEAAAVDALTPERGTALLIGPGAGDTPETRSLVLAALKAGKPAVLDADALSCFQRNPEDLFALSRADCVLTPHWGEFARLFPDLTDGRGGRLEAAGAAAEISGSIVVLKGPDTVIAAPDGRAVVNETATPYLATGGTGDVLAGAIAGLLAGGMTAFDAAAAGVWIQGRAGQLAGPGLIAEDLPELLPKALGLAENGTT